MTTQQWPDAPTPTAQETDERRKFDIWLCKQMSDSSLQQPHWTNYDQAVAWLAWHACASEAAPPTDTAMTALKEPLSDEQIEPLFRQINDMRVVGEKDEWFWFAWGVEMGERAHGIRSSGARHSAGTDRPGSDEKDVDYWIRQFTAARSAELELRRESESDAALFRASLDAIGALVLWVCAVPKDTILPEMPVYDDDAMAKTIAKLRERLKDSQ
jgi:hypothetical protein